MGIVSRWRSRRFSVEKLSVRKVYNGDEPLEVVHLSPLWGLFLFETDSTYLKISDLRGSRGLGKVSWLGKCAHSTNLLAVEVVT